MKTTEAFVYARRLAEFTALQHGFAYDSPRRVMSVSVKDGELRTIENRPTVIPSLEVNSWREKHPGFIPDSWNLDDIANHQGWLMLAWDRHFDIGQYRLVMLLSSGFDEPENYDGKLYPFQQAVLYLKENGWRARFCQRCGTHFVAESNQQKYCHSPNEENQTCASLARNEQKSQDHARHKKDRNRKQRETYARKRALLTASKMH